MLTNYGHGTDAGDKVDLTVVRVGGIPNILLDYQITLVGSTFALANQMRLTHAPIVAFEVV